jgi:hypothetical protein
MATFHPVPPIPDELANASQAGQLVVFVGAGVSRLVDCPSWDQFADAVLGQLVPMHIDYSAQFQINTIRDAKRRLSIARIVAAENKKTIDYTAIFNQKPSTPNVYSHLNALRCSFVTTNYELHLKPDCTKTEPEDTWRLFRREDLLASKLDKLGGVMHLHGCIKDPEKMVVTTSDYLEHYSSGEVQQFLRDLFARKIVLFIGYGLEETEVLEYILRKGDAAKKADAVFRRYILQGFFQSEFGLYEYLRTYYRQSFECDLIGFPKDYLNYGQLTTILEQWSKSLIFRPPELIDEAAALEEEIRG